MRVLSEGDKGQAPHPDLGCLVEVAYQRRKIYLASWDVEVTTLVGVHLDTDKWIIIPSQSSADVGAAVRAKLAAEADLTLGGKLSAGEERAAGMP